MSLLYTLSNILIPYSLLILQTIKRGSEGLRPCYGKWLVLFALTFIFNGLSYFGKWWILLIDLAMKCSLYFLPEAINEQIESNISRRHLEGYIEHFRNKIVNIVVFIHQKITLFLAGRLRPQEAEQFKQTLCKSMNQQINQIKAKITVLPKQFESTAINCTIISEQAVQKSLIKRQLQRKKSDIQKRVSPDSKRSNSSTSGKMRPDRQMSGLETKPKSIKHYQNRPEMYKSQPLGFGANPYSAQDLMTDSFNQMRQSSTIIAADFEEEDEHNKERPLRFSRQADPQAQKKSAEKVKAAKQVDRKVVQKKVGERKIAQKKQQVKKQTNKKDTSDKRNEKPDREGGLKRRHTDISELKKTNVKDAKQRSISPDVNEEAKIIEKLDVSVSEYSDMFQDDRDDDLDQNEGEEVKQTCKVEAIVQIGSPPQSKLQIYHLELYSNGELRIMSLYGRQFERHKLISMTKGLNNYYELHLSSGSVNKRKVKFRGQYQPFMKYIQSV